MKLFAVTLLLLLSRSELFAENSIIADSSPCDQFPDEGFHVIVDDTNCNCYWECFNGQVNHRCCQHCYVFDSTVSYCMDKNDPNFGGCGDRPEDDNCVDPTPKPSPCPYPDGYFKDDHTCDRYFICHNDKPLTKQCEMSEGNQFLYNFEEVMCDWPEKVDCGTRPICQTVEGDGNHMTYNHCQCQGVEMVPPEDFKCPPHMLGIFGDPFNCQKYYFCADGMIQDTGICEDNTYWDETIFRCIADGKCRGRPVCEDTNNSERCFCTQE